MSTDAQTSSNFSDLVYLKEKIDNYKMNQDASLKFFVPHKFINIEKNYKLQDVIYLII